MDFRNFLKSETGALFVTVAPLGGGSINISTLSVTTQSVITAPAPVWLEVSGITGAQDETGASMTEVDYTTGYDPTYHKVTYIWTVEEETSPGVWTQMTGGYPIFDDPNLNMVTAWNKAYVAYGKRVAFRLPDPGTYRFQVWCIDQQGNTGSKTSSTVTVVSPESVFDADHTIVVAADGDFTGAPPHNIAHRFTSVSMPDPTVGTTSWEAIWQAAGGPVRISFKNGETHADVHLRNQNFNGNLARVDTWDSTGATAQLKGIMDTQFFPENEVFNTNDETPGPDYTFDNITFLGDWDDVPANGDVGNFDTNFSDPIVAKIIFHNCRWNGVSAANMGLATFNQTTPRDKRVMYTDCIMTNFASYGVFANLDYGGEMDFLGCSMYRTPNASQGPTPFGPKIGLANDHGAMRIAQTQMLYLKCCDFFNNAGWSAGSGDFPSNNGCVRMNTAARDGQGSSWSTVQKMAINVDRCVAEGGYITWKLDGESDGVGEIESNYLFDKVLTICTARSYYPWSIAMGGATRRNCVTWYPPGVNSWDDAAISGAILRYLEGYEFEGSNLDNFSHPITIYNCTDVIEATGNQVAEFDTVTSDPSNLLYPNEPATWNLYWNELGAGFSKTNSVMHQPNVGSPLTAYAPINTSTVAETIPGVSPRFSVIQWDYQFWWSYFVGTISNSGGTITIPYSELDRSTGAIGGSSPGAIYGDTTPTDHAYWSSVPPADLEKTMVRIQGAQTARYYASRGDFTVALDEANAQIVITNTSWRDWVLDGTSLIGPNNAFNIAVKMGRASKQTTDIPPITGYANPASIPMPRPDTGSSALGGYSTGLRAYDSFDVPGVPGGSMTRTDLGAVES